MLDNTNCVEGTMNKIEIIKCLDISVLTGFTLPNSETLGVQYYGNDNTKRLYTEYNNTLKDDVTFFSVDSTDTQGLFYEDTDTLYIAFRGSTSTRDWLGDFMFWKKAIPFGRKGKKDKLHAGFLIDYNSVRDLIFTRIKSTKKNIIVTGHSLGGALATICSLDVQYNFRDLDVELVAFASPRVGNRAYRRGFSSLMKNAALIRVRSDYIPHAPPMLFGFVNIVKPTFIGKRKMFLHIMDHLPSVYYSGIIADGTWL